MDKELVLGPLEDVWNSLATAIPTVLVALVILIVGLLASSIFSRIVRQLIQTLKIDEAAQGFSGFRKAQDAGWKIRPSHIFGNIVKWFFIIVTLMTIADYLELEAISLFLNSIITYIPKVVVAIVLLAIGFIVGQFVHDIVKQSLSSSSMGEQAAHVTPLIAKYAIIIFAGMTAATHLENWSRLN